MSYKYGLTVMRAQPLHIGHIRLIDRMLAECDFIAIGLGSIQESGTDKNPFNFSDRKKMLKNYYKDKGWERITVFGVKDINNAMLWSKHVLETLDNHLQFSSSFSSFEASSILEAYYCGSEYDGHWFEQEELDIINVDRTNKGTAFVSGTMIRDMITYGDNRWKLFIPECNWSIIEKGDKK